MNKSVRNIGLASLTFGFTYMLLPGTESGNERKPALETPSDSSRIVNFKPSVSDTSNLSAYNYHEAEFYYNYPLETVWDVYTQAQASIAWNGPINNLKMNYHPESGFETTGLHEGNIILVELKLFANREMNALFKIIKMDPIQKEAIFCYADDNVTEGLQKMRFTGDEESTLVFHQTYYKSKWNFRDKILYPKFHLKCINEYHAVMHNELLRHTEQMDSTIVM